MQLLAGLVDTDGGEASFCSVSPFLAHDFVRLVRSLGGKATKTFRKNKYDGFYIVYWRMNERVPLSLSRKQPIGCKGRPLDYRRRVCRTVEPIGLFECGDLEVEHPAHCYVVYDHVIVSNSKTETSLAHLAMMMTGVISGQIDPETRKAVRSQFRGPVQCRIVLESLTTTMHPVIMPKLQWWRWNGYDAPGGERGHWGWIPKNCLVGGLWSRAWNEKTRLLRILCRDPDEPERILGESTLQIMAHNQEPSDFASGDLHWVLHDEPTTYPIWRENEARTMRTGGVMMMAMTWPDDPSIAVDWIYDTLYEPGRPGPNKDPNVDWFELWTIHNPHLSADKVEEQRLKWEREGPMVSEARLYGRPIRFSNRVHAEFTDRDLWWCSACKRMGNHLPEACLACGAGRDYLIRYNHVREFEQKAGWPTVFLLDPHPRKPHCLLWVQVDTWSDWWVVASAEVPGGPDDVAAKVREVEEALRLNVVQRIGDAKMLGSPSGAKRDETWRDEFDRVGLRLDRSDSSDVGRARVNAALRVDQDRMQPRLHFHPRCAMPIRQMQRFVWDDFVRPEKHDLKQKPKEKEDDYPALLRYFANSNPSFERMAHGAPVLRTRA